MSQFRIFISYGRDQYATLAARLAADLSAKGYEVWFDQELQSGRSWARMIQKRLDWLAEFPSNGRFVYLLSAHSTREKSFCLSEMQYALDNQVPVFPVLVEKCKIPIEIYPLQRLDLRPCLPVEEHPAEYQHLLHSLTTDMEGEMDDRLAQQSVSDEKPPVAAAPLQPPAPLPEKNSPITLSPELKIAPPPEAADKKPFKLRWRLIAPALVILLGVVIILLTSQSQNLLGLFQLSTTPTPPACTSLGQTWVSPADSMMLLCVPAGDFLMGSTDTDKDANANEKPQHKVTLDAFWIDQTEVTNAMYARFIAATHYITDTTKNGVGWIYNSEKSEWVSEKGADWQHPGGPTATLDGLDRHPVVQVSWNDAKAYCEWAGRKLPTEAQWEKAARGTEGKLYPWDASLPLTRVGNFADRNASVSWKDANTDDGYATSAPVGSFPDSKSPFGALDMNTNVREWVADSYAETYFTTQTSWKNPTGPEPSKNRTTRGGSWYDKMAAVRSAFRYYNEQTNALINLGFRCGR